MSIKKAFGIGDKVRTQDGRLGIIIDTDKNPLSQKQEPSQSLVVQFSDLSTTEALADKLEAVHDES
ncbi:hypothetical protein [Leptolyngbya sp. FACHB-16]|uniref:hypothetical protein n=1 Tax=unclassified Leptolyngbya TaxID=2650499 RepID=UPI001687CEF8|nr:hypothetical protein [Leptolyngbya sp. FACHB-16]MBD2155623.1 hypothetical protein [Leptolyngbya sp. FACHB-16]